MNDMQEALAMLRQQVAVKSLDDLIRRLLLSPTAEGPGGFTSMMGLFDEHVFVPSWTPKQFEKMWDGFSHRAKVNYVRNLITPKG